MLSVFINIILVICIIYLILINRELKKRLDALNKDNRYLTMHLHVACQDRD